MVQFSMIIDRFCGFGNRVDVGSCWVTETERNPGRYYIKLKELLRRDLMT